VKGPRELPTPTPARSEHRSGKGREDSAYTVVTGLGGHLLGHWPSAQGSLLLCTVQWPLYSIHGARTARGLSASFSSHGWPHPSRLPRRGSSPRWEATAAGSPREGRCRTEPRTPGCTGTACGPGSGVPPWMAQSIQPHVSSSKVTDHRALSQRAGQQSPMTGPLNTAFRLGQGRRSPPLPSLGTLALCPGPGPSAPAALQPRLASKKPFRIEGTETIHPFQLRFQPCWPPFSAAAASHRLLRRCAEGWAKGSRAIWGARGGKRSIRRQPRKELLTHKRQGRQREHRSHRRSRALCCCRAG